VIFSVLVTGCVVSTTDPGSGQIESCRHTRDINPKTMEFISASGKSFNTIHDNDINFYYHVNDVIQEEPYERIDAETRELLASIGFEKGKEFNPDERMKRILTDAAAIGNATSRSIVWYPRVSGSIANRDGIQIYPGTESASIMPWIDKTWKPSEISEIK
jgi:hypothetical protein